MFKLTKDEFKMLKNIEAGKFIRYSDEWERLFHRGFFDYPGANEIITKNGRLALRINQALR